MDLLLKKGNKIDFFLSAWLHCTFSTIQISISCIFLRTKQKLTCDVGSITLPSFLFIYKYIKGAVKDSLAQFLKSIFFSCPLSWSLEVLWDHCFTLLLRLKRGTFSFCFCLLSIFPAIFGANYDMRYALCFSNYYLIRELCSFPLLHDAILHRGWLSICYCSFLFLHELFSCVLFGPMCSYCNLRTV